VGFTPWQWIANPAFSSLPIEPAATPTSVSAQDSRNFLWGEHPIGRSRRFTYCHTMRNGMLFQKGNFPKNNSDAIISF
jgi:hypothetical protein